MNNYTIITDSGCDIAPELLAQWNVKCINLTFQFDGSSREYVNGDMTTKDFYQKMRDGACARTAAANIDNFHTMFEPELQQGHDVLYLGFSSGLSTTCSTAQMVVKDLKADYPERTILVVDTLCASAGQGLLVYMAVQRRDLGASVTENAQFLEEKKLSLCHWFTVDDLVYLKRGGRVSAAAALAGSVLGIKPVLHVDREGKLIPMEKVRGRRASLDALVKHYKDGVLDKTGTVFISHGDCLADAQYVADKIRAIGAGRIELNMIGPVIGAHSGPGTVALFYRGTNR